MNTFSFNSTFDVIIPDNVILKSSHVVLSFLYQQNYLEYYTNNSIYGTLKKSIFNIPVGTPVKMVIVNENIINIYFILNSVFYSIPIEFIGEFIE